jgi:hypothetical protein
LRLFTDRQHTLSVAYGAHPERFVKGQPFPPALPIAVWINPPKLAAAAAVAAGAVEPVGKSERSAELSTTPPLAAQKGEAFVRQDRPIRL